jgi:GDP-4-dehydro-6-deoxy-D-mannose reductase
MVRAYWLLLGRGDPGWTYNAASGTATSIQQVIEGFLALASRPIEVRQVAERVRPIDVSLLTGDASRLRALTGWVPTIPLSQSLEDTLDDSLTTAFERAPGLRR